MKTPGMHAWTRHNSPNHPPGHCRQRGWTLTELLISLALVGLLVALAAPTYQSQHRQARRADGLAALQQLQIEQARWRATHETYADDLSALGWASDQSPQRHYQISIPQASADGYTLQATPIGGQAEDKGCNPLRLSWRDSATTVLSAGTSTDSDPGRCWRQ